MGEGLGLILTILCGGIWYLERRVHHLEDGQARMEGKLDMLLTACPVLHHDDCAKTDLGAASGSSGP